MNEWHLFLVPDHRTVFLSLGRPHSGLLSSKGDDRFFFGGSAVPFLSRQRDRFFSLGFFGFPFLAEFPIITLPETDNPRNYPRVIVSPVKSIFPFPKRERQE